MQETLAIIFRNVPSNYSCKDILLEHLNAKKGKKTDISRGKLARWRRAIRLININRENGECHVVFSSIFYWCKYARLVFGNENKLKVGIYPHFFSTIQHPKKIQFLSCYNHQLIELLHLPQNIVSYCFVYNDILYISFKTENQKEYLIKIPSANISKMKIMAMSNNNNNNNNNNDNNNTEWILELNEPCQLFVYYHRDNMFICDRCNSVNQINHEENAVNVVCVGCGRRGGSVGSNNNIDINPNLNVDRLRLMDQARFYREISAFNTNIKNGEQFNVLSPLFAVLSPDGHTNIASLMFSNRIRITLPTDNTQQITNMFTKIDTQIIDHGKYAEFKPVNWKKLRSSIDSTFVWLSDKAHNFLFPILKKLLDFANPACFSDEMDEFVAKIEELEDMGTTGWLLCEAIMASNNMNPQALEERVEALERHYDDKGIVDIDDETAKGPFIYEMQLSPFKINIKEADTEFLHSRKEWQRLESVSTENYVISFAVSSKGGIFDEFKNIKPMMEYNGYLLIDKNKSNEIMHCLHFSGFDANFIPYGATICNNPLVDDKLIEYYKQDPIIIGDSDYDDDDENDNDGGYFIDNSNVYEPPKKKMKITHHHQNIVLQHDIIDNNQNIPDLMDISTSNHNNNNNNNNKERIEIISSIQLPKNEEIDDIIPQNIASIKAPKHEEIDDIVPQNINNIEMTQHISSNKPPKQEEIDDIGTPNDQPAITTDIEQKEEEISSISIPQHSPNKIIGRKRKRNQIIDSSPESSPSPSSSSSDDILQPISFMKPSDTKPQIKPSPIPLKPETKTNRNLIIKNKVGWSFGVPIYNPFYWDCADFKIGRHFPLKDFGEKCTNYCCRSDIRIERDLRDGRTRIKTDEDGADSQFLKGVPDPAYRDLFDDCFTMIKAEKMHICLERYLSEKRRNQRDGRKLIIYQRGWRDFESRKMLKYGIKEDMKERLLLLMRLYEKDVTEGVLDRRNIAPPWHLDDMFVLYALRASFKAIDLTNRDSDDDDDDDDDEDMKQDDVIKNRKKVRIKQEFGFDGEYDSEWE